MQIRACVHIASRDRVPGHILSIVGCFLIPLVLVAGASLARVGMLAIGVVTRTDHVVLLAPGIFVIDTAFVLHPAHGRGNVDAVVVAKVVEGDVSSRVIDALLLQRFHDAVAASVDGVVLELHDAACTQGTVGLQVASKGRNSGHENDDTEVFARLVGSNNAINDCPANLVVDRVLLVRRSRNEELAFC